MDELSKKYRDLDRNATLVRLLSSKDWKIERKLRFMQLLDKRVQSSIDRVFGINQPKKTGGWFRRISG